MFQEGSGVAVEAKAKELEAEWQKHADALAAVLEVGHTAQAPPPRPSDAAAQGTSVELHQGLVAAEMTSGSEGVTRALLHTALTRREQAVRALGHLLGSVSGAAAAPGPLASEPRAAGIRRAARGLQRAAGAGTRALSSAAQG